MALCEKTYKKEIAMCQKLYKKSKGCQWGKCDDCGVVPLLHKLYKGEIIEDRKGVGKLKNKVLNK